MNSTEQRLTEQPAKRDGSQIFDSAKLAHDLKGPLNSIKGLLHIATLEVQNEDDKQYFYQIEQYRQLIFSRINDFLNNISISGIDTSIVLSKQHQAFEGNSPVFQNENNFGATGFWGRTKRTFFLENTKGTLLNVIWNVLNRVWREKNSNNSGFTDLEMLAEGLKEPLNSIQCFLEIAAPEIQNDTVKNYLRLIEKSRQLLLTRIKETMHRVHSDDKSNVSQIDFNGILKEIMSSLKHMDGFSDIAFEIHINYKNPFISDYNAIYSIMQNLIENAVKYKKQDNSGHVVIIMVTDAPQGIVITVSDNGLGIKKELSDKVFMIGVRDKNSPQEGHGIGLSIVKQLTVQLGGQIFMESKINRGTAFVVKIPNSITSGMRLNKTD